MGTVGLAGGNLDSGCPADAATTTAEVPRRCGVVGYGDAVSGSVTWWVETEGAGGANAAHPLTPHPLTISPRPKSVAQISFRVGVEGAGCSGLQSAAEEGD